jgi:hypothetical protein
VAVLGHDRGGPVTGLVPGLHHGVRKPVKEVLFMKTNPVLLAEFFVSFCVNTMYDT